MWRSWRRRSGPDDLMAVLLPEPLRQQVVDLAASSGEVEAVRLVRRRTGLTLLPAVLAVRGAVAASG